MVVLQNHTLAPTSILSLQLNPPLTHFPKLNVLSFCPISPNHSFKKTKTCKTLTRRYNGVGTTISLETGNGGTDMVEELLTNKEDISKLMKMNRKKEAENAICSKRWFPYLDEFSTEEGVITSADVLQALDPYIMEVKKEKFKNVVNSRTYSVCLVIEGLRDFGNASAAFRSADALGFQSVHVISNENSTRWRQNRHVSMGAEKWLDIELWELTQDCFDVLRSRGYRIATTYIRDDTVSIYDMDWSCPTAIVVGNENMGISDEALKLSDLLCSIPMKGMVDSFNVSVAAGILMQNAAFDRTKRLGHHGDLTIEERQILLAEFSLRHNKNTTSITLEYANRKAERPSLKR